jgi:hypothetical protein
MKLTKKHIEALKNFKNAFSEMNNNYDEMLFLYLSDKYPFHYRFDELIFNVEIWIDEMLENQ